MVQMTNSEGTLEALHFACALACGKQAKVALVKMVPVQHPALLGTEFGDMNLTGQDREEMANYQVIASNYGVAAEAHYFQYVTLAEAVAEAADYVDAQIVFAALPNSLIPFWRRFHAWMLRRRLIQRNRQLYLLEHDRRSTHWTPSILVPAAHHPGSFS